MARQVGSEDKLSVTWEIEVTKSQLTPIQYHYLIRMRHLLDLKATYNTNLDIEVWLMDAINKAIFATFSTLNALKVFRLTDLSLFELQ